MSQGDIIPPQLAINTLSSLLQTTPFHQLDTTQVGGLILSPALDPVPQRLVQRIQSGQFVELRELLADNMAVRQRLDAAFGLLPLNLLPSAGPRYREISSILQWVYCFNLYVGVRTSDPVARDMLTYSRLLMREAMRHNGNGWLQYDRTFRRQISIDPTLQWNTLQSALHASTIVGNGSGNGTFCSLCRECDHAARSCALSQLQQPTNQSVSSPFIPLPPGPSSFPTSGHTRPQPRPETARYICASWNSGACSYPGRCIYRHVCATCQLRHMAKDCTDTPEDSVYKRPPRHTTTMPVSNFRPK